MKGWVHPSSKDERFVESEHENRRGTECRKRMEEANRGRNNNHGSEISGDQFIELLLDA